MFSTCRVVRAHNRTLPPFTLRSGTTSWLDDIKIGTSQGFLGVSTHPLSGLPVINDNQAWPRGLLLHATGDPSSSLTSLMFGTFGSLLTPQATASTWHDGSVRVMLDVEDSQGWEVPAAGFTSARVAFGVKTTFAVAFAAASGVTNTASQMHIVATGLALASPSLRLATRVAIADAVVADGPTLDAALDLWPLFGASQASANAGATTVRSVFGAAGSLASDWSGSPMGLAWLSLPAGMGSNLYAQFEATTSASTSAAGSVSMLHLTGARLTASPVLTIDGSTTWPASVRLSLLRHPESADTGGTPAQAPSAHLMLDFRPDTTTLKALATTISSVAGSDIDAVGAVSWGDTSAPLVLGIEVSSTDREADAIATTGSAPIGGFTSVTAVSRAVVQGVRVRSTLSLTDAVFDDLLPAAPAGKPSVDLVLPLPPPATWSNTTAAGASGLPSVALEASSGVALSPGSVELRQWAVHSADGTTSTLTHTAVAAMLISGDAAGAPDQSVVLAVPVSAEYDAERTYWQYSAGTLQAWETPFGVSQLSVRDMEVTLDAASGRLNGLTIDSTSSIVLEEGRLPSEGTQRSTAVFTTSPGGLVLQTELELIAEGDIGRLLTSVMGDAWNSADAAAIVNASAARVRLTLATADMAAPTSMRDDDTAAQLSADVKAGLTLTVDVAQLQSETGLGTAVALVSPIAAAKAGKLTVTFDSLPFFARLQASPSATSRRLFKVFDWLFGSKSKDKDNNNNEDDASSQPTIVNGKCVSDNPSADAEYQLDGTVQILGNLGITMEDTTFSTIIEASSGSECIAMQAKVTVPLPGSSGGTAVTTVSGTYDSDTGDWVFTADLDSSVTVEQPFGIPYVLLRDLSVSITAGVSSNRLGFRATADVFVDSLASGPLTVTCDVAPDESTVQTGYMVCRPAAGAYASLSALAAAVTPLIAAAPQASQLLESALGTDVGLLIVSHATVTSIDARGTPTPPGLHLWATGAINNSSELGAMAASIMGVAAATDRTDFTVALHLPDLKPVARAGSASDKQLPVSTMEAGDATIRVTAAGVAIVSGRITADALALDIPLTIPIVGNAVAQLSVNAGATFACATTGAVQSTEVLVFSGSAAYATNGSWSFQGQLVDTWVQPLGLPWLAVGAAGVSLSMDIAADTGLGLTVTQRTALFVTMHDTIAEFVGVSDQVITTQDVVLKADFVASSVALEFWFEIKNGADDLLVIYEALNGGSSVASVAAEVADLLPAETIGVVITTQGYVSATFGDRYFPRGVTIMARTNAPPTGELTDGFNSFAPGILEDAQSGGREFEIAVHVDNDGLAANRDAYTYTSTSATTALTEASQAAYGSHTAASLASTSVSIDEVGCDSRAQLSDGAFSITLSTSFVNLWEGVFDVGLLSLKYELSADLDPNVTISAHDIGISINDKLFLFDATAMREWYPDDERWVWHLTGVMTSEWEKPLNIEWLTVTSAGFMSDVAASDLTNTTVFASAVAGPFGTDALGFMTLNTSMTVALGGNRVGSGLSLSGANAESQGAFIAEVVFIPDPPERALTRLLSVIAPRIAESTVISSVTDLLTLDGVWIYYSNRDFRAVGLSNALLPAGFTIAAQVRPTGFMDDILTFLRPDDADTDGIYDGFTLRFSLSFSSSARRLLDMRTDFDLGYTYDDLTDPVPTPVPHGRYQGGRTYASEDGDATEEHRGFRLARRRARAATPRTEQRQAQLSVLQQQQQQPQRWFGVMERDWPVCKTPATPAIDLGNGRRLHATAEGLRVTVEDEQVAATLEDGQDEESLACRLDPTPRRYTFTDIDHRHPDSLGAVYEELSDLGTVTSYGSRRLVTGSSTSSSSSSSSSAFSVAFWITAPAFRISDAVQMNELTLGFELAAEAADASMTYSVTATLQMKIPGGEILFFSVDGSLKFDTKAITGTLAGALIAKDGLWEDAFGIPGLDLASVNAFVSADQCVLLSF